MYFKMYFGAVVIFLWQSFEIQAVTGYTMNMTEYFSMPKLYVFDDYDQCLQQHERHATTYCFVRAEILPNNNSDTWRIIEDISKYKRHHFDHRHLYYGLCVHWCEEQLATWNESSKLALYGGELRSNSKVNTYLRLFNMEQSNRQRYQHLMNQCLNLKLKQEHDLLAESVIEYCDHSHHMPVIDDNWNLLFYAIVLSLLFLTVCSSCYDFYLKHRRNDKLLTYRDHYKAPMNGSVNNAFVIFSLTRNWYRLTQEPNGKSGRDLRFLDCFKFFSMFLVIFAHTNWIIYESAISNPQDPERLLHTAAGTLLLSGSLITETFFVIGGLLLTLSWIEVSKRQEIQSCWQYTAWFIKFNVFRYIRLTLPYGFLILMSGTYFNNAGGPMWRHIMEREQLACRKSWWTNLLYLNGFLNTNERCLLQGWYLAADTHSFLLSLLLLMIAHKWPKISKYLYTSAMVLCFIIPATVAYVKNLDAFFVPSPQTQKDSFIEDRMFKELYTPFYMNFGCYFSGVVAALIYSQLSKEQLNLRESWTFQTVCYALIPAGILGLFATHPILQTHFNDLPLLWGSLLVGVQRNLWGIGLAVLIIGMANKIGWVIKKFSCLPIFRILGRLTYGAFVSHLFFCRLVIATLRSPIFFGTGIMFAFVFYTVVASYLFALVLALFVELPVSSLLKLLR